MKQRTSPKRPRRELGDCPANLPDPAVYEAEYEYWPWGKVIDLVIEWLCENAARSARVSDYMCGTGFLLARVLARRPDIAAAGCDLSAEYIEYAKRIHKLRCVVAEDVFLYEPKQNSDIIVCTAGLHHIERAKQKAFVQRLASHLSTNGKLLLGEEVLRSYADRTSRRLAATELGAALLAHVIQRDPPLGVLTAAAQVMLNDLFERGEYKTSLETLKDLLAPEFHIDEIHHVWPANEEGYGDVVLLCQKN